MERDSVTFPVKLETTTDLKSVVYECLSGDLVVRLKLNLYLILMMVERTLIPISLLNHPLTKCFHHQILYPLQLLIQKMYHLKVIKEAVPQLSWLWKALLTILIKNK